MASLDPAALERELAQLRRQRFEASQRVRASRQPVVGPGSQGRGSEAAGSRPGERRFGTGPPSARGEGPRGPPFRDGPLAGRLGPGPASRGGLDVGHPRGGRFDGPGRDGDRFGDRFGGPPARGIREPFGRGQDRDADRERDRDGRDAKAAAAVPARRRALLSSVVVGNGAAAAPQDGDEDREGEERGREDADAEPRRGDDREHEDGDKAASMAHEDIGADRKAAAGGRWGPAMGAGTEEEAGGRGLKRPAAGGPGGAAEDPDSRKRARRLLGRALLGTLQKFRQEDAQFQKSETAARRAELARKAEEKAAAESERLRRAAAEDRARKRQEELDELLDLNLATDIKVLELMYAKKLARHRAMAGFLRAGVVVAGPGPAAPEALGAAPGSKAPRKADDEEEEGAAGLATEPTADKMEVDGGGSAAAPPPQKESKGAAGTRRPSAVYWRPARHNKATLALKERQEQQLKEWEASVLLELEAEKAGLRQRAEARRASLVERRQQRAAAAHEGRDGGAAGTGAEEEAEDHEVLEAVELDMQHEEGEAEPGSEPQAPSPAAAPAAAGLAGAAATVGEQGKAGGSGKAADRPRGHREIGEHEEEGEHTVAMAEAEAAAAAAEAEAAMKEEEAVAAAEMLAGDEE